MRLALEHVKRMHGGAQAHLMRCDDDAYYVVKFQNNPQHLRVLANEMLATRLAARLGLCVPQVDVVEVHPEMIAYSADLVMKLGLGRTPCVPGKQFGSQFVGHPARVAVYDVLPDDQFGSVSNLSDFLGALVFDKWTCNTDKRQAIFVRQSYVRTDDVTDITYQAFMIDQGLCFNGGMWDFPDAPLYGLYARRCVYRSVTGIEAFAHWLHRLENGFTLSILHEEAQQVPPEWYGKDSDSWNRLIQRLAVRRTRVEELIWSVRNAVPDAFPNWSKRIRGWGEPNVGAAPLRN